MAVVDMAPAAAEVDMAPATAEVDMAPVTVVVVTRAEVGVGGTTKPCPPSHRGAVVVVLFVCLFVSHLS